jgi:hypothetical protein
MLYNLCFSLQNAVCFIFLTCLVLYYSHFIYRCAESKKNNSSAKRGNLSAGCGWVVNAILRPLYLREGHGTHCIGGWVGPRADLDGY